MELLVAHLGIFLVVFGNADDLWHSNGVEIAEGLEPKRLAIVHQPIHWRVSLCGVTVAGKQVALTHLPPPRIPGKTPHPPRPTLSIMQPPPRTKELPQTYILEGAVWKLSVPLVLQLCDLPGRLIVVDQDFASNSLLLTNAFHNVTGLQVHSNWITPIGHFMRQTLDLGES